VNNVAPTELKFIGYYIFYHNIASTRLENNAKFRILILR